MSIQYLSGVCKYLGHLDVSGCILLTDKCTKYLKKGCQNLKVLRMLYCRGVSKLAIQKLQSSIEIVEHSSLDVPNSYGYGR